VAVRARTGRTPSQDNEVGRASIRPALAGDDATWTGHI
jgi:hypothetical protein